MDMGEVIKFHRQRLGLSQQELGEKVGVNKAAVQKWENGTVENIKRSVIKKLSLIFDICPTELLGWSDQWSDCINLTTLNNNPLTNMKAINEILKQRRIELGLTMLDVSKAVGVSEGTVSRWESGDILNMRRDKIAALSKVLNISPAVIMGWTDPTSNTSSQKLSEYEQQLLTNYRKLNPRGKEKVTEYIDDLLDNEKYTREQFPDKESQGA